MKMEIATFHGTLHNPVLCFISLGMAVIFLYINFALYRSLIEKGGFGSYILNITDYLMICYV